MSGIPLHPDTFDAHHRRPKGSGGTYLPDTDTLPNLLALDPQVHNGGPSSVHGDPRRSRALGHLVHKIGAAAVTDPAMVPVRLHDGRLVLLTSRGGYQEFPAFLLDQ